MIETTKQEYLCPECSKPFDPAAGLGPYGVTGTKDGVFSTEEFGIRMTCGRHSWNLPGKTMLDVMKDFPVLAPGYIHMTLADQALRRAGLLARKI